MLRTQTPGHIPRSLAAVLAHNHTRVLDLFRVADENLDGVVTRSELHRLMLRLGIEVSLAELDELFVRARPFDQTPRHMPGAFAPANQTARCSAQDRLDPDASGGIEFRELQRALRDAASLPAPLPPTALSPPPSQRSRSPEMSAAGAPPPAPPIEPELRMLDEMLGVALSATASEQPRNPAAAVNLLRMLSAYEVVLQRCAPAPRHTPAASVAALRDARAPRGAPRPSRSPRPPPSALSASRSHGIVPVEDTRYYQLLLQLSLLPQPNWRDKISALRANPESWGRAAMPPPAAMPPHGQHTLSQSSCSGYRSAPGSGSGHRGLPGSPAAANGASRLHSGYGRGAAPPPPPPPWPRGVSEPREGAPDEDADEHDAEADDGTNVGGASP